MAKQPGSPTPSKILKRFMEQTLNASSLTPAVSCDAPRKIVVGKLTTMTWAAMFAELYPNPVKQLEVMEPFQPLQHSRTNSKKLVENMTKTKEKMQWEWRQKSRQMQGLHEEEFGEAEPGWQRYEKAFTEEEIKAYMASGRPVSN
ncbi:unnamed protein product [Orchesella dallaii]|uniref:Uncharacterized protein n=1 Tax=Orchesella dallaii TaxID=48710 RepID=A0ABP1RWX8_9HEXA